MELGERLRLARLEAGLSQRQLCGDTITRNMLSQIESGKAQPSMGTLRILAGRLGKPVGYFLEEEAPEAPAMARARAAYATEDFRQVLALLEETDGDGEEQRLLQALCLTELAEQALQEGRLPYARELLHRAGEGRSLYWTASLERRRLLLLWQAGEEVTLEADDRELLLRAKKALDREQGVQAAIYLDAAENRQEDWCILRGRAAIAQGQYREAARYLHRAEARYPGETAGLLELCYRELEDYKMAYYYACKQK
ncbi:MAG: helix-turn-helix domain-containing protein [Oscillospiraceae bacterium]|nr:helix-turn-helix domain-containing protein [Oscillospiraceae bacterium]